MRALFLGRFQPVHCGHFKVIKEISEEADYVVIAIGSAQLSHSKANPFTAGERYTMIDRALKTEGIDNYHIVPIEDLNRYSLWVSHVVSNTPKFDVVYANNPLSVRLFKEAGFKVVELDLYKPEKYSGTHVRKEMIEGEAWRDLVPKKVVEIIDEIDGIRRLKELIDGE
jgi:nicotinamide-nucleotide adenylyltransferase